MTTDHLTPEQKAEAGVFFGGYSSWGFGVGVVTRRDDLAAVPGRFGWDGGLGTSGSSDPKEDLVGILMTQRLMDSPEPPRVLDLGLPGDRRLRPKVTEGPFTEAKEVLGGYWMIQVGSKEEAIEWGCRLRSVGGRPDVRPASKYRK